MPHSKQAKRRLKQAALKESRTGRRVDKIVELTKQVRELVSTKKAAEATKLLPALYQALDKAAKKHSIHKNAAARSKSRLTILINKASGKAAEPVAPKKKSVAKKTAPKKKAS